MLKLIALTLLAVSCTAYPLDENVREEEIVKQYRSAAEKYIDTTLNWRFDNSDAKKVRYFLYTNQEPETVELKTDNLLQSLRNSSYDVKRPVKILIHDWLFTENHNKELITAYLRHFRKPVNVITVDYSHNSAVEYKTFMRVYQEIGTTVGKLLEELHRYGTMGDKMHIIGHGFGAHIAAVAAHKMKPFQVSHITGLDPVGLEFDDKETLPQLEKHDADFVDVISTNVGEMGSKRNDRGHVTFYPNGGVSQSKSNMFQSHLKAYFYYVESVARGKIFEAHAADFYNDFRAGKYDHKKVNYMGAFVLKNETGEFYLNVNPYPAYSTTKDVKYQPEKVKIYQTYFGLVAKKLQPWGFTSEEKEYFKNGESGKTIMDVEGEEMLFGRVPLRKDVVHESDLLIRNM